MMLAREKEFVDRISEVTTAFKDLSEMRRTYWLLFVALTMADAEVKLGLNEDSFAMAARLIHRKVREALSRGVSA